MTGEWDQVFKVLSNPTILSFYDKNKEASTRYTFLGMKLGHSPAISILTETFFFLNYLNSAFNYICFQFYFHFMFALFQANKQTNKQNESCTNCPSLDTISAHSRDCHPTSMGELQQPNTYKKLIACFDRLINTFFFFDSDYNFTKHVKCLYNLGFNFIVSEYINGKSKLYTHFSVRVYFFSLNSSSSRSKCRLYVKLLHITSKQRTHVEVFQFILRLAFDLI